VSFRSLRSYTAVSGAALKQEMSYSLWFFSFGFAAVLETLVLVYLWKTVLISDTSGAIPAVTISYVCMSRIVHQFTYPTGQLPVAIRSGNIGVLLLRPLDLQLYYLSYHLGTVAAEAGRIALPMYAALTVLVGPLWPPGDLALLQFAVSLVLAILVGFLMNFGSETFAFWTMNTWGIRAAREALVEILSGSLIPLFILPGWSATVVSYLPFAATVYVPSAIFTGLLTGAEAWRAIAGQAGWAVAMFVLTRLLWRYATRRVVIQGG